jgi:hypothetical protein
LTLACLVAADAGPLIAINATPETAIAAASL